MSSKWGVGWDTYLASQRNFIVANIDVRGTGFQVSRACNIQHSQSTLWNHSQTVHVSSEIDMKDIKIVQSNLMSLITNQLLSLMSSLSEDGDHIDYWAGGYSRMLIELQYCN